jgi:2-polyprenyl-3-methyl-5-hydroxy-6-metoxy-1,4-benzoquinol methylase
LGYDFNEKYITEAKKVFSQNGNIKFLLLNAYEKVELNQTFDFIIISGLLHHLDDSVDENVFNVAKKHMNLESILIKVDPTIYNGKRRIFRTIKLKISQ